MIYQVYVPPVRRACNPPARQPARPVDPISHPLRHVWDPLILLTQNMTIISQLRRVGNPPSPSVGSMTRLVRQSMASVEVL